MSDEHLRAPEVANPSEGFPSGQTGEASGRPRTELAVAELQHRVRNLLALVQSVVRRTAASSETVEDYAMHLEGRLSAIARGQDLALRSRAERGIDLAHLLAEELLAHGAQEGEQVKLDGPPIELRNRAAALLGLAFHELTVNAVKFGALRDRAGRINVEWRINDIPLNTAESASLWLQWRETVGSSRAGQAQRQGFGTELIERMLAYELGAEAKMELLDDGLLCTIAIPATQDISPGQPVLSDESG